MNRILVYGLSPQKGGVEVIILNIIKYLSDNIEFDILLSSNRLDSIYESLPERVNIIYITSWGENRKAFQKELEKILKLNHYDYLWINACLMSNIDIINVARKSSKLKIITHSHGSSFEEKNVIKKWLLLCLHKFNRKFYLRNIDYPCMCSLKSGLWYYGRTYINKAEVFLFKNGIEINKFRYNEEIRQNYRNDLRLQGKIVLLHAGRLTDVKNQFYLIDIVSKCKDEGLNIHLLIAGEGELEQQLKSYVKKFNLGKDITFLGSRDDIANLYQASDLFLLPSHHEGFPVTLTEAQVSGLRCLVSSNISEEVNLTGNVKFIPITSNAIKTWVDEISSFQKEDVDRSEYADIILHKRFDLRQIACDFKRFIQA